jgi:MFS family permease
MVSELAPAGRSATAVGFALTLNCIGIISWPPLLGVTADAAGSFRWSWLLLAVALVVSLVPLTAIGRVDPPAPPPPGARGRRG